MEREYTQSQKDEFKERLKKIISTKIMTSTIFCLAGFERCWGSTWGHGKVIEDLTDEEYNCRIMWEKLRDDILTNANKQKKNAMTELDNHSVVWNRYITQFIVNKYDSNEFNEINGNLKTLGEN